MSENALNPSTRQARAMVAALAKHGVAHVVVAPGSRNAPLSIALAQQDAITVHMRIDERTAAFTALGIARASGVPTAVVCTSGTAVANFTPAVYEAHESGVPLLLITADRPPEVRGRGANQTIEQAGLFSLAVRAEWDLPLAADRADQYWELAVANAVSESMGDAFTAPGPVHLNVPFAEPLVPPTGQRDWAAGLQLGPPPPPRPTEPVDLAPLLADLKVPAAARGVVVISDPRSARPALALAKLLGWPVLAEPGGGPRDPEVGIRHYAKLLADADFASAHQPDVVITCGRFGLSRAVARYVRQAPAHIAVGRFPLDADPFQSAGHHVAVVPLPLGVTPAPSEWLESWQGADQRVPADIPEWGSRRALAEVLATLGEGEQLWVAASQTVRIADDLLPLAETGPRVFMNRGANGIDGLIASATGAALAAGNRRTTLVLGDIAALHDLSSLAMPDSERRPALRIVVLDNGGGAIFRGLEQGAPDYADVFDRVFGTPTTVDLAGAAAALGWRAVRVEDAAALVAALGTDAQFIVCSLPAGS